MQNYLKPKNKIIISVYYFRKCKICYGSVIYFLQVDFVNFQKFCEAKAVQEKVLKDKSLGPAIQSAVKRMSQIVFEGS